MATSAAELDEWLARVRELAPLVERYRDEAERQRRLPPPPFRALRDAGLFGLWLPRTLGGAEVRVETSVGIVEELSRLDGAVGWNVMIAGNTSILRANLEQHVAAEMVAGNRNTVSAGTVTSGSGTALVVDLVFKLGGTSSIYAGRRLERCFRDVHVVEQHAVVSANATSAAGRYFLGLGLPPR